MANIITTGPGAKKETVYGGPSLPTSQGAVYNGPSPAGATVYNGPTPNSGGTVYNGPTPGMPNYGPAGTVYNPRQMSPQPQLRSNDPAGVQGANFFFAIAIFTAIRTAMIASGSAALGLGPTVSSDQMSMIVLINILIIGVFVLIGIFARHGSKAAFLIGMLLYGADTVLLLMSANPAAHVSGIVVHVIFLLGLVKYFRQLG
jgi:hypothetical protein